ncbi:MAG: cytochrome b/b6 domain-containing protein [Cryobacterium sp.]|uniref:cytochrome b/b6 domain-containing protein n=1 Tax=unclassified Cryobacterium TaxID=2649013 RepID=UPI0018C9BBC6|nr:MULTISPECIES: cytochrome b/b6 domain-containing protein [unclassified Cryobacterium]MCY7403915.1 cytochrome b/b6 domain-containing protein [Cryobacterium sp.]MEC5153699.1 thiosulfate reductase cytochrome b subunit [Cryobacterium sp. CAN_C3]
MTTGASRRRAFWLRTLRPVWIVPILLIALALVVLAANGIRALPWVESFSRSYPGVSTHPTATPIGIPAWLAWQHGLNAFFILFVIRTGWQVRTSKRPTIFWTRRNAGLYRTRNPPIRITLDLWQHIVFDTLWVVNGVVFYVLLFATGQWLRLVPTSWDVFPNAASAGLQYASLNWPTDTGWVYYNALQLLSYFVVVFIAAPIALVTGLRLSPGLSARFRRLDHVFPLPVARTLHCALLIFFVAFIVVHVTLVLTTGARANLNHMYAARNDDGWTGVWIFVGSILFTAAIWVGARPLVVRAIAARSGRIIHTKR